MQSIHKQPAKRAQWLADIARKGSGVGRHIIQDIKKQQVFYDAFQLSVYYLLQHVCKNVLHRSYKTTSTKTSMCKAFYNPYLN